MAHITYRCEICASEILASSRVPAPHVCVLCRLSADEALEALQEDESVPQLRYRGNHRAVSAAALGLRLV